jgi:hypothetical protein
MTESGVVCRRPSSAAVLQSNYIPWKGYFDIIHDVDLFVFYDCVQFTPRDWRTRNKIKTAAGLPWLTIPVGADRSRPIHEVAIPAPDWQKRHWESLKQNYGKCPHYSRYRPWFEHVYLGTTWTSLSELNQSTIRHIAREFLGITTTFADSREYAAQGHKLERLIDLVRKTGATSYLSGPAARDYIVPESFAEQGVELLWKDYAGYPEYPQRFPPFEHGVTILDLLFNTGPDAPWYIWGWRSNPLGP